MHEINSKVKADVITHRIAVQAAERFKTGLVGAELGIAYGGGVEAIGKLWRGHGVIHGFDTFTGHPTQLAYSQEAWEAKCMTPDYIGYGYESLTYEYQRRQLDAQGLDNVILHKGLINEHSLDDIPVLHYALLDLDFIVAMVLGYTLVRTRIVPGGYLCLHDVVPRGNMIGLWGLYQEIVAGGEWSTEGVYMENYLVVLQRK